MASLTNNPRHTAVHPAEQSYNPRTGLDRRATGLSGRSVRDWNFTIQLDDLLRAGEPAYIRSKINTYSCRSLFSDQENLPSLWWFQAYMETLVQHPFRYGETPRVVDLVTNEDSDSDSPSLTFSQEFPENQQGVPSSDDESPLPPAPRPASPVPLPPTANTPSNGFPLQLAGGPPRSASWGVTLTNAPGRWSHLSSRRDLWAPWSRGTFYGRLEIGEGPDGNIHLQCGWHGLTNRDLLSWRAASYALRCFLPDDIVLHRRIRPKLYYGKVWRQDHTCPSRNADCTCWPKWFIYCCLQVDPAFKKGLFAQGFFIARPLTSVSMELLDQVRSGQISKKRKKGSTRDNKLADCLQEIKRAKTAYSGFGQFLMDAPDNVITAGAKAHVAVKALITERLDREYAAEKGRPKVFIWIHGKSGSGKDCVAREQILPHFWKTHYPDIPYNDVAYLKDPNEAWCEKLKPTHKACLLSDLRIKSDKFPEGMEYSRLLQLTNRTSKDYKLTQTVPVKHGSGIWRMELIVVTTIDTPRLFLAGLSNSDRNDPTQLLRRITHCIHVENSCERDMDGLVTSYKPFNEWRLVTDFTNPIEDPVVNFSPDLMPAGLVTALNWTQQSTGGSL